jgi:hypothetical protein
MRRDLRIAAIWAIQGDLPPDYSTGGGGSLQFSNAEPKNIQAPAALTGEPIHDFVGASLAFHR